MLVVQGKELHLFIAVSMLANDKMSKLWCNEKTLVCFCSGALCAYLATSTTLGLAMLCKETGVTTCAVCAIIDLYFICQVRVQPEKELNGPNLKRRFFFKEFIF